MPKSTSESQAQITHLLTGPEPARGTVAWSPAAKYALQPLMQSGRDHCRSYHHYSPADRQSNNTTRDLFTLAESMKMEIRRKHGKDSMQHDKRLERYRGEAPKYIAYFI